MIRAATVVLQVRREDGEVAGQRWQPLGTGVLVGAARSSGRPSRVSGAPMGEGVATTVVAEAGAAVG